MVGQLDLHLPQMTKKHFGMASLLLKLFEHLPAHTVRLPDVHRPHPGTARQGVLSRQTENAHLSQIVIMSSDRLNCEHQSNHWLTESSFIKM